MLTDFDLDNEVECFLYAPSQEIYKTAFELLTTYGDTVNKEQLLGLKNLNADSFASVKNEIESNKLCIYTNKHKAFYMYIYRVL